MGTANIDLDLLLLRTRVIIHAKEFYSQFYDTNMDERELFITRLTDSFLERLADLILQRDIIAELNRLLEEAPLSSLSDYARTGLLGPDTARSILRRPHEVLFIKNLRAFDEKDIWHLREIFRSQYIQEILIFRAFLQAHEEAGRQCPLQYHPATITLELSKTGADIFGRLAKASRTDLHLFQTLRELAAKNKPKIS